MKLINFSLLITLAFLCLIKNIHAQEEDEQEIDDEIEIEDVEQEVLEETIQENAEISEELQKELATGIVNTSNYPGRIISRKKVISKVPAAGQVLEFEYTIWNVGNSDVSDIELVDDSFTSENFENQKMINIRKDVIKPGQSYTEVHSVVPKMNEAAQLKAWRGSENR